MKHRKNLICITLWLHIALLEIMAQVNGKTTTVADNCNNSTTTVATLPDLILRYAKASPHPLPKRRHKVTTTSPYIPQRLTDPPLTSQRPEKQPSTPQRLTDPATELMEPVTTTYELSVTPVVLPPRKVKSPESIREDCRQFGIVPELLDAEDTAPHPLQVRFLFEHVARFGNTLDPKDMVFRPYYVKWKNSKTDYYSLLMLDMDYPDRSNPYMRSYLHWQVVNIKGDDWIEEEAWAEYIGPNPLYGTGFHRYIFFVLKQPSHIHFTDLRYPEMYLDEHRANFSLNGFRKKYNLELHAMNFFLSESKERQFPQAEQHLNQTPDLIPRAM